MKIAVPIVILCWILFAKCEYNEFDPVGRQLPDGSPPNFFFLGGAKCASTTFYDIITSHDEVCKAKRKEIHFFDGKLERWSKGSQFYLSSFVKCKGNKYIDATPTLLYQYNHSIARLKLTYSTKELSKKKFLIILREPVQRHFSNYNQFLELCLRDMVKYFTTNANKPTQGWNIDKLCGTSLHCLSLDCYIKAKDAQPGQEIKYLNTWREQSKRTTHSEIETGFYFNQIEAWVNAFSRKQFLIINFDTFISQPVDTMNRVASFFELSHGFPSNATMPHDNSAGVHTEFDCETREFLHKLYEPHNQRLYEFLKKNPGPAQEPSFPLFKDYRCTNTSIPK